MYNINYINICIKIIHKASVILHRCTSVQRSFEMRSEQYICTTISSLLNARVVSKLFKERVWNDQELIYPVILVSNIPRRISCSASMQRILDPLLHKLSISCHWKVEPNLQCESGNSWKSFLFKNNLMMKKVRPWSWQIWLLQILITKFRITVGDCIFQFRLVDPFPFFNARYAPRMGMALSHYAKKISPFQKLRIELH